MKITKNKLLLPISISATALVACGVVYAFSSSSFLTQAQNYVSSQCNSALISSKNTVANNQKATVCYNYYKNIEQDASIVNLTNKSNAVPYLDDGNGNVLGIYIDSPVMTLPYDENPGIIYTYFNSSLNLKIPLNLKTGNLSSIITEEYATYDCSGIAYENPNYVQVGQTLLATDANRTTKQYFYISSSDAVPVSVALWSKWDRGVCAPIYDDGPHFKLTEVSPNITFPIALPITIK